MKRFQAEADCFEAKTKPMIEEARMKQLADPKGAPQPDIAGVRASCDNATMLICETVLQQGQECVLLTALNSQIGPGIHPKIFRNKPVHQARQMATSMFLSGSSVPTDMSQGMDVMMMYVIAQGRYAVSSSIVLDHKSDAWMSPKLKDAIRKGQSISFCLFDDHTSAPVTNDSNTEQSNNGHAFCIRLKVVLGKRCNTTRFLSCTITSSTPTSGTRVRGKSS